VSWRSGLLLLATALAGFSCAPHKSWRYKMIVEVETPQGLRTGSAVREIGTAGGGSFVIAESKSHYTVRGEAVVVELPGGKRLFALLRSGDGDQGYAETLPKHVLGKDRIAGNDGWSGSAELYPLPINRTDTNLGDPLPMLVTYADPKDPKSIQRVDPANMAATFGPGVKLKSISIESTEEPVTTGIEKKLPPFGNETGYSRWRQTVSDYNFKTITMYDFKREK
jgi:hypothetical protein